MGTYVRNFLLALLIVAFSLLAAFISYHFVPSYFDSKVIGSNDLSEKIATFDSSDSFALMLRIIFTNSSIMTIVIISSMSKQKLLPAGIIACNVFLVSGLVMSIISNYGIDVMIRGILPHMIMEFFVITICGMFAFVCVETFERDRININTLKGLIKPLLITISLVCISAIIEVYVSVELLKGIV